MERRRCAAVYAVCRSAADIDRALGRILSLAYTESRERYVWGLLLDLSPSLIFRACGDAVIEERVRRCFLELEAALSTCACFALLRGRRYGIDRVYRCEGGLRGALSALSRLTSRSEDDVSEFTLSLGAFSDPICDGISCESIFILQTAEYADNALPGTVSRSAELGTKVAVLPRRATAFSHARHKRRGNSRGIAEKTADRLYECDGWFTLGDDRDGGDARIYHYASSAERRGYPRPRGDRRRNGKMALHTSERAECAAECVDGCLCAAFGLDMGEREAKRRISELWLGEDECRCTAVGELLLSATAIYALGRLELSALRNVYDALCDELETCFVLGTRIAAPAFLRLALLICASEAEALGVDMSVMYLVCGRLKRLAELLRRRCEDGRCAVSEQQLHLCTAEGTVCLHYLALCSAHVSKESKRELLAMLCGGRSLLTRDGITRGGKAWLCDACLAVCAAAEVRTSVFSRRFTASSELSAHASALRGLADIYEPCAAEAERSRSGDLRIGCGRGGADGRARRLGERFDISATALRCSAEVGRCFAAVGARADVLPFAAFLQAAARRAESNDAVIPRDSVCIETEKLSFPLVRRLMEGAGICRDIERLSARGDDGGSALTVLTSDSYGISELPAAMGRGCEVHLLSDVSEMARYRENAAFYRVIRADTSLSELI